MNKKILSECINNLNIYIYIKPYIYTHIYIYTHSRDDWMCKTRTHPITPFRVKTCTRQIRT